MELIKRLWKEEEGQGLVEYILIIAIISIIIILAGKPVSDAIKAVFDKVSGKMDSAADSITP
jgi:pilus assembly protein Flp/PilA